MFQYLFGPFSQKFDVGEGLGSGREGREERDCFLPNLKFNLTNAHLILVISSIRFFLECHSVLHSLVFSPHIKSKQHSKMDLRNLEVHLSFSNKSIQSCRLCPLVAAEAKDRPLLLSIWAEGGRHLIDEWRNLCQLQRRKQTNQRKSNEKRLSGKLLKN